MKAELTEIMESIQGEGLLLGTRQIFLRFSGCNLRCAYCDTPASLGSSELCTIYQKTGSKESGEIIHNPLSIEQVSGLVGQYDSSWISLTGGEPLLWADYLQALMETLKPRDYRFLLETNGTLPQQLDKCLPLIDMVSMDFKLPSATRGDHWNLHREFLLKAQEKPCYVKIVITADTTDSEISRAVEIINGVDRKIPLILQPVSPRPEARAADMERSLKMQQKALQELYDVRLIPQMHPLMGLI